MDKSYLKSFFRVTALQAVLLLIGGGLLLGACAAPPASSSNPGIPVTGTAVATARPAVEAAIQALAGELKIPDRRISVVSIAAHQWPDSCLGLPNPGEMCAMHVVPGYRVTLKAGSGTYAFRTSQSGDVVRPEKAAPFY
jgi:hypothetical protein